MKVLFTHDTFSVRQYWLYPWTFETFFIIEATLLKHGIYIYIYI